MPSPPTDTSITNHNTPPPLFSPSQAIVECLNDPVSPKAPEDLLEAALGGRAIYDEQHRKERANLTAAHHNVYLMRQMIKYWVREYLRCMDAWLPVDEAVRAFGNAWQQALNAQGRQDACENRIREIERRQGRLKADVSMSVMISVNFVYLLMNGIRGDQIQYLTHLLDKKDNVIPTGGDQETELGMSDGRDGEAQQAM